VNIASAEFRSCRATEVLTYDDPDVHKTATRDFMKCGHLHIKRFERLGSGAPKRAPVSVNAMNMGDAEVRMSQAAELLNTYDADVRIIGPDDFMKSIYLQVEKSGHQRVRRPLSLEGAKALGCGASAT
jgi:hypothetical protein